MGYHYRENVCSFLFPKIRVGSHGCTDSRKIQWPVLVEFPVSQPADNWLLP